MKNIQKENIADYCAPGTTFKSEMIPVKNNVSLKVITFSPPAPPQNPAVVFVSGWVSLIEGWKQVLLEMTKDFTVYYIETREKISSQIKGKAEYNIEAIAKDIVALISQFDVKKNGYILLGSSLGATAILDACHLLKRNPLCLVLIGPNAVFRVPKFGMVLIRTFYPPFYFILRPFILWYLKHFRLDTTGGHAQYEKYRENLFAADPWKLKKAALAFSQYEVWDRLEHIEYPTLIFGASKDKLHEPENLERIFSMMKYATYIDMETNEGTHSRNMVEKIRKYIAKLGLSK